MKGIYQTVYIEMLLEDYRYMYVARKGSAICYVTKIRLAKILHIRFFLHLLIANNTFPTLSTDIRYYELLIYRFYKPYTLQLLK